MAENSNSPVPAHVETAPAAQPVQATRQAETVQGSRSINSLLTPATLLELALRMGTIVFALAALISAAVVLGVIDEENFRLLGDVVDSTEGAAGWVICLAGFTMAAEIGFIALVCLRAFGIVTLDSEMFIFYIVKVVDIIISAVFENGYLAGGIVTAVYAGDYWRDAADAAMDNADEVDLVHDGLAVTSAFCFVNMILFVIVVVWNTISLFMKRYKVW